MSVTDVKITEDILDGPMLNLGSGPVQPDGWANIDGSNRAFLTSKLNVLDTALVKIKLIPPSTFRPDTKFHNLFKPLPYEEQSVACIYAGEVWEHFEYDDALKLTKECFRVLKPGGVLRICVPDGVEFWQRYLDLCDEQLAKPRAQRNTEKLRAHVQIFYNDICTRLPGLKSMGHFHKWTFDEAQLIEMFELAGFYDVERMPIHTSRIPDVSKVERSDFLIVEGVKH